MPSHEIDTENPLALDVRPITKGRPRLRRLLWTLLGLAVGIPSLLTLIGALTSPPHVKTVPVGHLISLTADAPSEHTSMLRGLNILGADGTSRTLAHETEPQDTDSGSRDWMTQPAASPDGQQVAFIKEVITLQEERQSVDNQLWVMALYGNNPQPKLLLDLSKSKLKAPVGLTWTNDSRSALFLEDATQIRVAYQTRPTQCALQGCPALTTSANISATRDPVLRGDSLAYTANTPRGPQFVDSHGPTTPLFAGEVRASQGAETVSADKNSKSLIRIQSGQGQQQNIPVRWGWSIFGGRHIMSLRWSPDGRYVAYTVSKPPLEDELFYVDLATRKCYQLPIRPGAAAWDWTR